MKKRLGRLKRVLAGVLVASTFAVGISGCGSAKSSKEKLDVKKSTETQAASSETSGVVRIGVPQNGENYLGELENLAYQKGYLDEEIENAGYKAEIVGFTGAGPEMNEALAGDSIDVAVYGDFPTFTVKNNGVDVTVIASTNHKQAYGILAANKEIKKPKDLEGKKVIVPQGTAIQFFWDTYAKINDIDTSKVEIINTITDSNSLLASGEADALASTLYSITYMESVGLGNVLDDEKDVKDGYISYCVTALTDYLKENPKVGVAINKALIRAYEDAQKNPEEYFESVASDTITVDMEKKAYAFDPKLEYLNPQFTDQDFEYYKRLNKHMVSQGIIRQELDLDTLFDTSYYDQAVEELKK
ncbi:MAG: ABC transporter substrate-binding protein [Lachnospiraceae bacterium]